MSAEADVASSAIENEQPEFTAQAVDQAGDKDDVAAASPATDEAQDDNTAVKPAEGPKSMLEAVQAATSTNDEPEPESSPGAEVAKSEGDAKPAETDGQARAKPDEDETVPFHKHPRWQEKLKRERELKATLEQLTPKAQEYEKIQAWAETNSIGGEEFVAGMEIMAAMKNDPFTAKKLLAPYWEALQQATGEVLPPEVKEKLEIGLVDEETARENARLKAETAIYQKQRLQEQQRLQQQQERTAQMSMKSALDGWEAQQMSLDPDYAKKRQPVTDRLRLLIADKRPSNPQQVVELARQAYSEVDAWAKSIASPTQKPGVRTVTSANASSTTARPAPRTLAEAVAMAGA